MKKMFAICCAMLLAACISLTGCGKEEHTVPGPTDTERKAQEIIDDTEEKIDGVMEEVTE